MNKEEISILNYLKQYLQDKIDDGYHKLFYGENDYDFKTIDAINAIEELQHQLEEKDKVIKKQNKIINQVYNNIESTYSWRKEHSTPNTVNVPLMTLCEEQLEILERGKKCY